MWTIDAGTRGIAMAACALVGTLALAEGDTLGSPTDLGHRGRMAGTCSVSLSPDGRSVTSLHRGHQVLSIEAIRPGGVERKVHWRYAGGFDNHRWASHHPDYMVVVDEVDEDPRA